MLVIHTTLKESPLTFNLSNKLVVIDRVKRVISNLLRSVSEDALKFSPVVLADVLTFF